LAVEVERTQEGLRNLSMQESRAPTPEKEEVLLSNPMKESHQCEVTMLSTDKNQNGKRNPETQITGKKARKLSKKKAKLEKLQEVPERTLQKEDLQNLNFVWNIRTTQIGTSPWQSNMTIGGIPTIRLMLQNG
jgi:hypothetical protein